MRASIRTGGAFDNELLEAIRSLPPAIALPPPGGLPEQEPQEDEPLANRAEARQAVRDARRAERSRDAAVDNSAAFGAIASDPRLRDARGNLLTGQRLIDAMNNVWASVLSGQSSFECPNNWRATQQSAPSVRSMQSVASVSMPQGGVPPSYESNGQYLAFLANVGGMLRARGVDPTPVVEAARGGRNTGRWFDSLLQSTHAFEWMPPGDYNVLYRWMEIALPIPENPQAAEWRWLLSVDPNRLYNTFGLLAVALSLASSITFAKMNITGRTLNVWMGNMPGNNGAIIAQFNVFLRKHPKLVGTIFASAMLAVCSSEMGIHINPKMLRFRAWSTGTHGNIPVTALTDWQPIWLNCIPSLNQWFASSFLLRHWSSPYCVARRGVSINISAEINMRPANYARWWSSMGDRRYQEEMHTRLGGVRFIDYGMRIINALAQHHLVPAFRRFYVERLSEGWHPSMHGPVELYPMPAGAFITPIRTYSPGIVTTFDWFGDACLAPVVPYTAYRHIPELTRSEPFVDLRYAGLFNENMEQSGSSEVNNATSISDMFGL